MVDAVKNVCRERLECDPWRLGGVCHSGSRNSGMGFFGLRQSFTV